MLANDSSLPFCSSRTELTLEPPPVWAALDALDKEPHKLTEQAARAMLERLYGLADADWDE
jgi:hypothetical protein